MQKQRNSVFLVLLLFSFLSFSVQIYVPEHDQYQKPSVYSSGIKTVSSYERPSQIQYHHNYSRVHHQNQDGYAWNNQNEEEPNRHGQYPVYNSHTYGNRPTGSERLTQIYVLNGTRIRKNENPVRRIAMYNKQKRMPKIEAYRSCPFNVTGQLVYEFSCHQFLNCWKGRGHVQNCAPGTLFNPKTLECDFPEKVECVSGPRVSILRAEQSSKFVRQIGCPKGFTGLIPNYTDCSKFINCVSGIENCMDCPPGTLFDINKNICDFADTAECFNRENEHLKGRSVDGKLDFESTSKCKGGQCSNKPNTLTYKSYEVRCPENGDGLHPHPTDCSKYLNCNHGRTYIQDCAPGTLFNPTIKICDYPYNVRCQNTGSSRRTTPVPSYNNPMSENSNTWGGTHQNGYHYDTSTKTYNRDYETYAGSTGRYNNFNVETTNNRNQYPTGNNYDYNNRDATFYQGSKGFYRGSDDGYYQQTGSGHATYPHTTNYNSPYSTFDENRRTNDRNNNRNNWGQNSYDTTSYGNRWNHQGSSSSYDNLNENQYSNWKQPQYDTDTNRNIYPQTKWNSNSYSDSNQYPSYNSNNRATGSQRGEIDYNSSNVYGQNGWRLNGQQHQTYNSRPYGTPRDSILYNSSYIRGGTYRDPNQYQNNYNLYGPDPTIRQRGESGYNRQQWYDQNGEWQPNNNRNQERIYPNYDQVVNINHPYGTTTQRPFRKPFYSTTTRSADYEDTIGGISHQHHTKPVIRETTPRILEKSWPPPFPSTDVNADYVFEYDDNDESVTLEAENAIIDEEKRNGECGKSEFRCSIDQCVSKMLVCDGNKDCPNGLDELKCLEYVSKFSVRKEHKLAILEKERWDNISIATCALLCTETRKFQCRSFNYRKVDKTCFLTDTNEALTGALISYYPFDYYEAIGEKIDCSKKHICSNKKCIDRNRLCDGIDDCGDRGDEKRCKREDFGYSVRLTGSQNRNEGNIEVTAFGKTGYVCDDNFGLRDADVVCKELGFGLGAVEVKKNSYFSKNSTNRNTFFMMDDVTCSGNETRLMDCDFSGWGVHNCLEQEIAGVVCKTAQEKCADNYWQCETKRECLPMTFLCDGLLDCSDGSDEKTQYCDAPVQIRLVNGTNRQEGRVEIKHNGIWGTICDDDFNEDAAKVICKFLGYKGSATVRKEAYFGPGTGPIWLDQVFCSGNETSVEYCTHWNWNDHNCEHSEDVGVICSNIYEHERHSFVSIPKIPQTYPHRCGYRKDNIFNRDDDVHFRVVRGSVAKRGDYPWQAALRVKGKTDKIINHWCGAVIISEKFVLTAAHCLMGYPKGSYVVVAGDYDIDENEGTEQEAYIEDYYIHEQFREGHKMNNDIALVKLKGRGFRLNDDIQAICLPDNSTLYETDLNCTISGFGSIQSGKSSFSHQLRAGWIPLQKREICTMPHVYGDALTEGMICAGSLDEGIDACDGDSGGPLACLHDGVFTLFGITSWGQRCGYANKPGVYVKIAHYRKWIDENFYKHSIN